MTRLLIVVTLTLLAGSIASQQLTDQPGFILIAYGATTLETSLLFGVIAISLTIVSLTLLALLLTRLLTAHKPFQRWRSQRAQRRYNEKLDKGLNALEDGQWKQAEHILASLAKNNPNPSLPLLGAARAAHGAGYSDRADQYLNIGLQKTPESAALSMERACIRLDQRRAEEAVAILSRLPLSSRKHTRYSQLLYQGYDQLKDWQKIIELIPELVKRNIFTEQQIQRYTLDAHQQLLIQIRNRKQLSEAETSLALKETWDSFSKVMKRDSQLAHAYITLQLSCQADDTAEAAARKFLNHQWNNDIVLLYGRIYSSEPKAQLVQAEAWLKQRPNNAELLLTLGRFSLMNHLWGKAKEYFLSSAQLKSSAAAYGELSRLLEHLGEEAKAKDYQHKFIADLSCLPELPLPSQ